MENLQIGKSYLTNKNEIRKIHGYSSLNDEFYDYDFITIPRNTIVKEHIEVITINEQIGEAAMNWLRNADVGLHPSIRISWNACYQWLLENGHIKK